MAAEETNTTSSRKQKLTAAFTSLLDTALKHATGGKAPGTSVSSAVGYHRYASNDDSSPYDNTSPYDNVPGGGDGKEVGGRDGQENGGGGDGQEVGARRRINENAVDGGSDETDSNLSEESFTPEKPIKMDSVVRLELEQATRNVDTITEWQAGWNITNAIQGMFIVSFPYAVYQGGYWALMAMALVAHICCYTGKILVDCLYEVQQNSTTVRVRTSYADIAEQVLGHRFGRPLVNSAQVIELLMTCILYVLLCGELLKGSFPTPSVPLSAWITMSTVPLLFCSFIKTMRRVSWLSLWCSIAHMLINMIIVIYCLTLVKEWKPKAVQIKPDIFTVPISLGVIVFSYTSQIFLPTLEGKMVRRDRFSCMMHWTHLAAAIFKVLFSYIGFITFAENTEEVITNNLPTSLKIVVNLILVLKALFSYPLPYFAAVEILETSFFNDQKETVCPSCFRDDAKFKWWAIILRLLLVIVTMLMAVFIPHFAILMGLIGSFTGCMLSFVWPCVFHIYLKRNSLRWWYILLDVIIILLGILCGLMGIYYSAHALVQSYKTRNDLTFSAVGQHVANETMKHFNIG